MKFDQIAFYCQSKEAEANVKKSFGLTNAEWIKDTITEYNELRGKSHTTNNLAVVEVQKNIDLGLNLEIIRYLDGHFWSEADMFTVPSDVPIISHCGLSLSEYENWPQLGKHWLLLQETFTRSHTNSPHRLHYRIYGTMGRTYFKYVKTKQGDQI